MFQIKMGKFWKNTSRFQFNVVKTTLRRLVISKWLSLFCKFLKDLFPFLCHFVTYNREYYEWLCRLRRHIQVGWLPVQGTWLDLLIQSVAWGSMWPTGQTCNNSVIRWWRCPLPNGLSLTLPHPNSSLETHFVLLAKIIEYGCSTKSLSLLCVHWYCVNKQTNKNKNKNLGDLMERYNSQPRQFIAVRCKLLQTDNWSFC